ncbi:hypothetical protein MFRU_006g02750 [Monilinia fructicola]|nr:hypothetical protein MFRU_006g02750 [Monilinia fructicola]
MLLEKLIDIVVTMISETETLLPSPLTWQDMKNLTRSKYVNIEDGELEHFAELRERQTNRKRSREQRELEEDSFESPLNLDQTHLHSATSYNRDRTPPESPDAQETFVSESRPEVDDTLASEVKFIWVLDRLSNHYEGASYRYGRCSKSYVSSDWLNSNGIESADKQIRLQWHLHVDGKQPDRHFDTNFIIMSKEMLECDIILGSKCRDTH